MFFATFSHNPEVLELPRSFSSILENESVVVPEITMNVERYN